MRIWLDDYRDPKTEYVQKQYGADPNLIWIKTPPQMVDLIKSGIVKFIDFDHDLGCMWSQPSNGYEIAKLIEELAFKNKISRIDWKVHSDNPVARKDIIRAMKSAETYWSINEKKCEYGGEA